MTSHAFQDFQDANDLPDNGHAPDGAVNALRDLCQLAESNLPAVEILNRIATIARAALSRLGVPVPVEVEDCDRCGQCFPDDEAPF